ncbi:MAG: hypothetical protein ACLP9L_26125 [Thermoguttaceae bacterium]
MPDLLHVIAAISNPARYVSRYEHFRAFRKHVEDAGAILHVVEAAFGQREFEVTREGNPNDIQVRAGDLSEIWLKENLQNIGLRTLPPEARYVAFIDGDLSFARPDWVQETLHRLQHYSAVQMFSNIVYLDSEGRAMPSGTTRSFVDAWSAGKLISPAGVESSSARCPIPNPPYATWGAPGGAWAWRREVLDQLGGLLDINIVGSNDFWMSRGLIGEGEVALGLGEDYTPGYRSATVAWQDRALKHVRENIGLVPGTILHHWHGPFAARGYEWRWKILVDCQFDPATDLTRDGQGLLRLHDDGSARFLRLRNALRNYFAQRNEDARK